MQPKFKRILYGGDYNPNQWPEEVWKEDMRIFKDARINSATINVFSWAKIQPSEHEYNFAELDKIVEMLSEENYDIVFATSTAALPGWMVRKYPEVMSTDYEGRQHRRSGRESLDCAYALEELRDMGIDNFITFDAHDPRVQNSTPLNGFDNFTTPYQFIKSLLNSEDDMIVDKDHLLVISPDEGALDRAIYFASVLGVDTGMFYKRRDYSTIVNGKNPIVAHEYMGNDVAGKDVFIADDIISSGESMLDIAVELKKRKANKIYCYATYPIFTNGLEAFNKAYADGIIDGVFGTNLTYRTPELLSSPWFYEVDCSKYIAYFIASLNHDKSISQVIDPHTKIEALLKKYGIK